VHEAERRRDRQRKAAGRLEPRETFAVAATSRCSGKGVEPLDQIGATDVA
jgi:hypothetical protein